jgi:hypothetical protein
MTVWIFVGVLTIGSSSIDVAPDAKFAFADKAACESAIVQSKKLRCIELKVVGR